MEYVIFGIALVVVALYAYHHGARNERKRAGVIMTGLANSSMKMMIELMTLHKREYEELENQLDEAHKKMEVASKSSTA